MASGVFLSLMFLESQNTTAFSFSQENGLIQYYHFDPLVVWKFFALVEKSYHATNPYHNAVHAADVTQAMSR